MITRKSDLAIRALRTLAAGPGQVPRTSPQRPARRADSSPRSGPETVRGVELADAIGTSRGFLGQAMTPLVRAGWVSSMPGPLGGYRLQPAARPSVLEVIEAIEGPTDTGACVLDADAACAATTHGARPPCALHDSWIRAQRAMREELGSSPAVPTALASNLHGQKETSHGA